MAVRGSIVGRAQLREVITKLEITSPAELEKNLLEGTRKAVAGSVIKKDVQGEAVAKLPKRHGYAAVLAKAVKVSSRVSGGRTIKAAIQVSATGRREGRDVASLNRGVLRHPLFGNRKRWYPQLVRRGLVDEPIDRARDRVVDNAQKAADAYADSIVRG